jgi:methionyl-tRNA formyltransferase
MKKVVFFGMESDYSALPLLSLVDEFEVSGIYLLENKEAIFSKAKKQIKKLIGYRSAGPYSIRKAALVYGIELLSGQGSGIDVLPWLKKLAPDFIVVSGFSYKVPAEVLQVASIACINIHSGLLPEYRGAHPFFYVLKARSKPGGVTIHFMNENFDDGRILKRVEVPLITGMNLGQYNVICAYKAGLELPGVLNSLAKGEAADDGIDNPGKGSLNCRKPGRDKLELKSDMDVSTALWLFQAFSDTLTFYHSMNGKTNPVYQLSRKPFEGSIGLRLSDGIIFVNP